MFYVHPDGSSGELPDSSPLPVGAVRVPEQVYAEHLQRQLAADSAAVAAANAADELAASKLRLDREAARNRLQLLGLSPAEAAAVLGGSA